MRVEGKRGDTLVNFAFIIGMLILSVVVTISLTRFSLFQSKQLETDALLDFSQNIKNTLEKTQSAPNDADFIVRLEAPLAYTLTVDRGTINLEFPQYRFQTQAIAFNSNTNVIGRKIQNSGLIYISKRGKTIIITDDTACDTTDRACDPGCIIAEKCDPACYKDYLSDVCSPYCVDSNPDSKIDEKDNDGICDPDCYGRDLRGGTYDPDCLVRDDGICDPNTDGNKDKFCDTDCLGTNGVCDADCTMYDPDCPHFGNKVCETNRGERCTNEPDCSCDENLKVCMSSCPAINVGPDGCVNKTSLFPKGAACVAQCQCNATLVCDTVFGTKHCCSPGEYFDTVQDKCVPNVGDGICKTAPPFGENCGNSTDCTCPTGGCCAASPRKDAQGCVQATSVEGEACSCDSECTTSLSCAKGACCPAGKEWDAAQNKCVYKVYYDIVYVPIGIPASRSSVFESESDLGFDLFKQTTPFKECSDVNERVRKHVITLTMAQQLGCATTCSNHCGDCISKGRQCVLRSQWANEYELFAVFTDVGGPGGGGCAGGIPFDGSSQYLGYSRTGVADGGFGNQVFIHEAGHNLGLSHESAPQYNCICQNPPPHCSGPCGANCPQNMNFETNYDKNWIMDYCSAFDRFSPSSYTFLKTNVDYRGVTRPASRGGLTRWLQGCG